MLFDIDPNLQKIRNLKERYITFNRRYGDNYKAACAALKELIRLYYDCPYPLFHEFEHLRNRFLFRQSLNASLEKKPFTGIPSIESGRIADVTVVSQSTR